MLYREKEGPIKQRLWVLPAISGIVVAALGAAINFATDSKTSWLAWGVVICLTLLSAAIAVSLDRRVGPDQQIIRLEMEKERPEGTITMMLESNNERFMERVVRENYGLAKGGNTE
jgi:hypothetical protein